MEAKELPELPKKNLLFNHTKRLIIAIKSNPKITPKNRLK